MIEKALEIANKEKRNSYDYDDLTRTAQKSYEAEWQRLKTGSVKFAGALKMTPSGELYSQPGVTISYLKTYTEVSRADVPQYRFEIPVY